MKWILLIFKPLILIWNIIKWFKRLLKQLLAILKNKANFALWFLTTIIGGNIGVFSNAIIRHYINNTSIMNSIKLDYKSGSFYIFSIVLLASSLGSVLIELVSKRNTEYKLFKAFWIVITFFVCLLCGLLYSGFMSSQLPPVNNKNVEGEIWQIVFFILSIFLGIYSYCLVLMNEKDEDFANIRDNYEEMEKSKIAQMEAESDNVKDDGKGTKL